MELATQEASVLTRGSGTALQTLLARVKKAARQKINALVMPRLQSGLAHGGTHVSVT